MTTLIHLDTDIGGDVDDLCALAGLLGWSDAELVALTTVIDPDGRRAGMARHVLDRVGRTHVPVAAGAGGSLSGYDEPPGLPDIGRYWREPVPPLLTPAGAALDLLAASIAGGATIVEIGPWTNLALLETARPGSLARANVVLMGGYITPPDPGMPEWGPNMDWNVQADKIAARIVLGACDPVIVPLPVCFHLPLRAAHLPALRAAGRLGELLAHQAELHGADYGFDKLGRAHTGLPDDLLNFQYDPLAVAVAAGWEGARIERLPLTLEEPDGWIALPVRPGGKPTRAVTAVDPARFERDWLAAVARAAGA